MDLRIKKPLVTSSTNLSDIGLYSLIFYFSCISMYVSFIYHFMPKHNHIIYTTPIGFCILK